MHGWCPCSVLLIASLFCMCVWYVWCVLQCGRTEFDTDWRKSLWYDDLDDRYYWQNRWERFWSSVLTRNGGWHGTERATRATRYMILYIASSIFNHALPNQTCRQDVPAGQREHRLRCRRERWTSYHIINKLLCLPSDHMQHCSISFYVDHS